MAKKRLADLQDLTAHRFQNMTRRELIRKGSSQLERQRRTMRSVMNFFTMANFENAKRGSKFLIAEFMREARVKRAMNARFQQIFPIINRWKSRKRLNKQMLDTKREALDHYFRREVEIMLAYYKPSKGSKSKEKKKNYEKLGRVLDKNVPSLETYKNLILDEYFWKVCYAFYQRQIYIWILLTYKYLGTSKFAKNPNLVRNRHKMFAEEGDDNEKPSNFPIYLLDDESEKVFDLTKQI